MGLFGFLGHKNKSSDTSKAPEIADLPPIPDEKDTSANLSAEPGADDSFSDIPDLPVDDTQFQDSSLDLSADDMDVPSDTTDLDDAFLDDTTSSSSELPDASAEPTPEVPQEPVVQEETPKEVPVQPEPQPQKEIIAPPIEQSQSIPQQPSLPVFDEVAVPTEMDVEALAISELFIKREQYAELLETLHTTQKELDALVKKSALAKPNEKIGTLLKKATGSHAELNKSLMFIEEHLVE